jgi:hypothetical protein
MRVELTVGEMVIIKFILEKYVVSWIWTEFSCVVGFEILTEFIIIF